MASPACVHLTFAQGCDVNMVADLIDELKEEYATVKNKEVFTLINKLEKLNKATSRSKKTMAEIEKIIGAASRSFSVVEGFDFPGEPVRVHPKPKSPRPRSLAHRTPLSLVASLSSDWIHRQGRHHDHRGQGDVNILSLPRSRASSYGDSLVMAMKDLAEEACLRVAHLFSMMVPLFSFVLCECRRLNIRSFTQLSSEMNGLRTACPCLVD